MAFFTLLSSLSRFVFTCLSPLIVSPSLQQVCFSSLSPQRKLAGPWWSRRCGKCWTSWLLQHGHTQTHKETLIDGICGAMSAPCMWVGASSRVRKIKDCEEAEDCAYICMCVWECVICWCKRCVCLQTCQWSRFKAGPCEALLVCVLKAPV